MNKLQLFNYIAEKLWDDEMIDINNYNNNFENFKKDFFSICLSAFDGIALLKGEILD